LPAFFFASPAAFHSPLYSLLFPRVSRKVPNQRSMKAEFGEP
jgi:hypothetical protein